MPIETERSHNTVAIGCAEDAAKFGATIDHISGGRWGINVVTGYSPKEARMFGGKHIEHDRRYERGGSKPLGRL